MRKGIILAGGQGTRLSPTTLSTSKQLLPVYDKPMIYYPLTVLMLAGVTEVLVITKPQDLPQFEALLGNGRQWGISIDYKVQPEPKGLVQAYYLAEKFLNGSPSILILGDNIFHVIGFEKYLNKANEKKVGATIFSHHVADPQNYGVVEFDENNNAVSIVEKPLNPLSNYAVTGLYFMDETAPERAKFVRPSKRGELEITSLLELYLTDCQLDTQVFGRGCAWFDAGTHDSLFEAANYVRTMTKRQHLQIGSPDEVAYLRGLISVAEFESRILTFKKSDYGSYLKRVLERKIR